MSEKEVTVKYKEEDITFDLDKPEDLDKAKHLISHGLLYEKEKMAELGELRTEVETLKKSDDMMKNWEARLTKIAKGDEKEKERFIQDLDSLGITITPKQDKALDQDDDLTDPQVKALKSELDDLKKQLGDERRAREQSARDYAVTQIEGELNALELKYAAEEYKGYPKFEKDKVLDYANKHGMTKYETAYFDMYREEIIEAERQKVVEGREVLRKKREGAKPISDSHTMPGIQRGKAKNYDDAARLALENAKAKGESFFTD
jgi:hypothetical protein